MGPRVARRAGPGPRIRTSPGAWLTSSRPGSVDPGQVHPDLALTHLTPLLGSLLSEGEAGLCDRELVEAVRLVSGASGVALWRELGEPGEDWRAVLEVGSAQALPAPEQVHAVLCGALDGELGERARVLGPFWPTPCAQPAGSPRGRGLAVSLGGPCDGDLELVEALLLLFARVEAVGGPVPGSDALPAPLPYPRPPSESGDGSADVTRADEAQDSDEWGHPDPDA